MQFDNNQYSRDTIYLFGDLNPEVGTKTLLKAMVSVDVAVKAVLYADDGHYTFTDIYDFVEKLGILERIKIMPKRLYNPRSFASKSILAVVVPSLSDSLSLPKEIHTTSAPRLVSATAVNREIVVDGVTGLFHSPGNYVQLGKQLDFLYKYPGVTEQFELNVRTSNGE